METKKNKELRSIQSIFALEETAQCNQMLHRNVKSLILTFRIILRVKMPIFIILK